MCPAGKAFRFIMVCAAIVAASEPARPDAAGGDDRPALPKDNSIDVSAKGMVELHVVDTPLSTVLRMLSVQGKRNIVATPAATGTVTADLYNVSFDEALRVILLTNGCGYEDRDGFIYVHTLDELEAMYGGKTPIRAKVFWLNYINAADVVAAIQPLLSADAVVSQSAASETGIKPDSEDAGGDHHAGNDFVIVYDRPEQLAEIGRIIRQLDIRPRQVLIEATILRARLTDDNALGIDFSLLGGVDLQLLGSTSVAVQNVVFGNLPTDRFEKFNSNVSTNFVDNVPDGGLSIGIIKDHVAVFIRALEEITDTSVIANPKILALNKQVANVIVGRRDGYITTTVTQTQSIQKVEFLETGTQLTLRPHIGTDGYVRLEIHPEDSVGGLSAAQLPFEQTTEVTTNVLVKDGHTVLIGGLFREVSTESRSQIPFLGDLPKIGDLFRSRSDKLDREEVIILLTVHIIKSDDDYAELSIQQVEDIERARISLRGGMMWHGRERLAQGYYRKAVDYHAQGNPRRALASVDLALRNHPRFVSAIKLREEINQAREWEDDASIARNFIARLIMRERGIDAVPFGRPGPPFDTNVANESEGDQE